MAIVEVSNNRGALSTTTGGANPLVNLPAGASIAVGNTLLMLVSSDNSGTLGVDPNLWVVSSVSGTYGVDLRGNLWWRIARVVRSSGAANDGAVAEIWACLVGTAYANADNITLQYSFPVANLNVRIAEYSGLNARSYSVVTGITGTGNGTTIGPTGTITPTLAGQMVVGVSAVEDTTALTGDADVTDGAWVTIVTTSVGAGVTGNSIMAQRKIVSGVTTQDWDVTKVGAADWAALAVVFEAFTSVPNGFNSGNPNYPCIAGAEILTLGVTFQPIDTGTQYLQTHQIFPNSYGTQNYNANHDVYGPTYSVGDGLPQHTVIHEVYAEGSENVSDEITQYFLGVDGPVLGGGATVSSGGVGSALDIVGGAYVTLPSGGFVDLFFFTTNLLLQYPNYRVVRWGIRYAAWKDDSAAPGPGEGMIAEWRDSAANNGTGASATVSAWLVQNYKRDAQMQTRWVGEVNPIIRGKGEILPQNAPYNAAFTINDISHLSGADQTCRLRLTGAPGNDPSQTTVYLDYVQMVVEVVPERRLGQGTRLVSFAPAITTPAYTSPIGSIPMWSATNSNNKWQVPSSVGPYVLGTREALPASPADYYANLYSTSSGTDERSVGMNEAFGSAIALSAHEQPRAVFENPTMTGQPVLRRATVSNGVLSGVPEELDQFILSVMGADQMRLNLDGSFWPAYDEAQPTGANVEVYTGHAIAPSVLVDGTTQFNRVKVLVYPDELTTANLTITVEQPSLTILATATLTVAVALALPDIGNGWREVSVALNVAVTPAAGQVVIRMSSTTPSTAPWRVSRSAGSFDSWTYNYPASSRSDYAAVLQCTLVAPSVSLGNSVQNMYRPDGRCIADSITLPTLTLTNGALYDWVSIERSLDAGTTYTPVVLLADPTNAQVYIDSAVPWDQAALSISYRVTGFRNADHLSDATVTAGWNAVATAPGVAFGLAAPNGSLYAYLPTSEGNLDVTWNPLNPSSLVPLLGVDYQILLRAPEQRGLSVSFLVIVDQLLACGVDDVAPWDESIPATGALSPAPFDQLRALALTDRFSLLLPGGHSRFVALTLGGLTIKTSNSLYLAEVTLTDVTLPEIEPYEADTT